MQSEKETAEINTGQFVKSVGFNYVTQTIERFERTDFDGNNVYVTLYNPKTDNIQKLESLIRDIKEGMRVDILNQITKTLQNFKR